MDRTYAQNGFGRPTKRGAGLIGGLSPVGAQTPGAKPQRPGKRGAVPERPNAARPTRTCSRTIAEPQGARPVRFASTPLRRVPCGVVPGTAHARLNEESSSGGRLSCPGLKSQIRIAKGLPLVQSSAILVPIAHATGSLYSV